MPQLQVLIRCSRQPKIGGEGGFEYISTKYLWEGFRSKEAISDYFRFHLEGALTSQGKSSAFSLCGSEAKILEVSFKALLCFVVHNLYT
jgi:hypothetical protein